MKNLDRIARNTAKVRGVPPEVRHRIAREVRDHLEDAREEYESIGCSSRKAGRLAVRDFGDVRKARTDLSRAWRRKRTVLFPEAPGEGSASFLIYDLRLILIILGVVLLLRWQVVAAYHIPTKSMEPTLHGDKRDGDKILVNKLYYRFFSPERWQVAVFEDVDGDRNLIKRVVGLEGETLGIRNGDVYGDGRILRKPRHVEDELLVPVFRDNRDITAEVRGFEATGLSPWEPVGEWTEPPGGGLFAVADEEGKACLGWNEEVHDDIPGDSPGSHVVGDLVLAFTVTPGRMTKQVGAVLREGRDTFEFLLPVDEGDTVLLRNREKVGTVSGLFVKEGDACRIRLSNLDDFVRVEVDGREILTYEVPNASTANDTDPGGDFLTPAEFGIKGGSALFTRVELSRDIYYVARETETYVIPEGHYFMMGDNSDNSEDSRSTGPIGAARLIGRPLVVIWPVARMKVVR